MEKQREQRRIRSIEVGFRLIDALERAGRKLSLKDVAAQAGMPPSKAHLYMVSFLRIGLVVQDPVTMRYGLGPYVVRLGLSAIRQLELVDLARASMEALRERTGLAVFLSVWGNRGPTVLLKLDGRWEIPLAVRQGYVLPILSSATGQVFHAYLPERETATLVAYETEMAPEDAARARDTLPEVRATGLAVSDQRLNQGFAAVSAAIFDHEGRLAAALTVLGLRAAVDLDRAGPLAGAVAAAAETISRSLGAAPPAESDLAASRSSAA
ncbi:MAG TPA: IclR family transcriptional regulator [Alphaproteobacteria bacterium]